VKKKGDFYMNYSKSLLRKTLLLALILGMAILVTGCSVTAARTVGLPGLTPLANADQVKLIEKFEDARQPYQIVGQVTLAGTPLYEGASYRRMKEMAAGMGADGLIGLHWVTHHSPLVRSGLAVKWLAPDEAKRALSVPFVVAVLPIKDQTAPDKEAKVSKSLRESVLFQLERKGYYVLPVQPGDFKGGIEEAKALGDTELRAVGGEDAQLLLGLTIQASANANIVVMSGSSYSIKTTILDKRTRNTVFERVGTGTVSVGWLLDAMAPNEKYNEAAGTAAETALGYVPAINQEVGN
jgi:hypothetical protein